MTKLRHLAGLDGFYSMGKLRFPCCMIAVSAGELSVEQDTGYQRSTRTHRTDFRRIRKQLVYGGSKLVATIADDLGERVVCVLPPTVPIFLGFTFVT